MDTPVEESKPATKRRRTGPIFPPAGLESLDERLLDDRAAAAFLGCALQALRNARTHGVFIGGLPLPPHIKMGTSVRYSLGALRRYVREVLMKQAA